MDQRAIGMAEEMQEHQDLYDYIQEHGLPDKETFFSMIVEPHLAEDAEYYSKVDAAIGGEGEDVAEESTEDTNKEVEEEKTEGGMGMSKPESPMGEMPVPPKKAAIGGKPVDKSLRMKAMMSAMA